MQSLDVDVVWVTYVLVIIPKVCPPSQALQLVGVTHLVIGFSLPDLALW